MRNFKIVAFILLVCMIFKQVAASPDCLVWPSVIVVCPPLSPARRGDRIKGPRSQYRDMLFKEDDKME